MELFLFFSLIIFCLVVFSRDKKPNLELQQLRYLFFERLGCYGFQSLKSSLGHDGLKGYMDTLDFYDKNRNLVPVQMQSWLDREIQNYRDAGYK